jgi:uncharacterized Zn finger protein
MEYCNKCKSEQKFREVRRFPIPNGYKVWVSCNNCNAIKLRVVKDVNK